MRNMSFLPMKMVKKMEKMVPSSASSFGVVGTRSYSHPGFLSSRDNFFHKLHSFGICLPGKPIQEEECRTRAFGRNSVIFNRWRSKQNGERIFRLLQKSICTFDDIFPKETCKWKRLEHDPFGRGGVWIFTFICTSSFIYSLIFNIFNVNTL